MITDIDASSVFHYGETSVAVLQRYNGSRNKSLKKSTTEAVLILASSVDRSETDLSEICA